MSDGLHHLHLRKRIYRKLERYPHPQRWKRLLDYAMYAVAICAPLVMVPQVIRLYATQDTSSWSLITWSLFVVINVLWVTYATVHRELPVAISSGIYAGLDVIIVIGILLYS